MSARCPDDRIEIRAAVVAENEASICIAVPRYPRGFWISRQLAAAQGDEQTDGTQTIRVTRGAAERWGLA